jgi:hypothetical protein
MALVMPTYEDCCPANGRTVEVSHKLADCAFG